MKKKKKESNWKLNKLLAYADPTRASYSPALSDPSGRSGVLSPSRWSLGVPNALYKPAEPLGRNLHCRGHHLILLLHVCATTPGM